MSISEREERVQKYYDRNTSRFLTLSRTFTPNAIHQPLYENPGMTTADALHTPHRRILGILPQNDSESQILDLGCGVGESLVFLARQTGDQIHYHGITLSGEQAEMARKYMIREGLAARVRVYQGSFLSMPVHIPQVDVAFAIESFIHCTDSDAFFSQVAAQLLPGGTLIIFDDFLTEEYHNTSDNRVMRDLRAGWLANTMLSPATVTAKAAAAGLRCSTSEDLTGMLRLNRFRDKMIRLAVPVARLLMDRSEFCRFMVGGDARQRAYSKGYLSYRMMVFAKG